MTKVLCVSDTHGRNEKWIELIKKVNPDVVIHSGDHCTDEKIMNQYANFWVSGNNDYIGNEIEIFKIEDIKFILMHGHQANRFNLEKWKKDLVKIALKNNANVLIYGHSHIQDIDKISDIITINPGSLELPRNAEMLPSYVTFIVDCNKIINLEIHFYEFT
ncbi:YfcE family phosphodiesterase [Mycoplasmoides alvi]|uniref:YfcE family phosphodiesterase n=1 Tax=Mycoplasmoides alvi TaxID=78580 RepID=UPI00051B7E40|nr:metallophosphoesterase [Mycoplasmoides alvi]